MQIIEVDADVRQWLAADLTLADRARLIDPFEQLCESFDRTVRDYLEGPEYRKEEAREAVAVVDERFNASYRPGQPLTFHRQFLSTAQRQLRIG